MDCPLIFSELVADVNHRGAKTTIAIVIIAFSIVFVAASIIGLLVKKM